MEKGSFRVGSIMGIPVHLHLSFLFILPFLAWVFGNNLRVLAAFAGVPASAVRYSPYAWGLGMALALFASVLLHELGHSYVARVKGARIRSITLMLFGGVAQLEEMPSGPGEEAQIALVGPVVSFLVGGACYAAASVLGSGTSPDLLLSLSYVGYMNLFLGGFNLLPAFPMDGGRVLRSLLARRRPFVSATRTAVSVGKVFAFAFGILGLLGGNLFLVLIAFFVYMGATQELHHAVMRTTLDGYRVRDLMASPVATVNTDTPVDELVSRMLRERHMGYPVVAGTRVVGCVTLEDIDAVEPGSRAARTVADIMSTNLIAVGPDDDIYQALQAMGQADVGRVLVMEGDRLAGIISRSDVMRGFHLRRLQGVAA